MSYKKKFDNKICKMSIDEKIKWASDLTDSVVGQASLMLRIHASNQELIYTDQISSQVPLSYAAHTFNLLLDSQMSFEILRLTSIWDNESENRQSIPTILRVIRDVSVLDELQRRCEAHWDGDNAAFGLAKGAKVRRQLDLAIKAADRLKKSSRLKALFNFRDNRLAHNLDSTAWQVVSPRRPDCFEYRFLLDRTLHIITGLNCGIRSGDFKWRECRQVAQRRAKAFWGGVTVRVRE